MRNYQDWRTTIEASELPEAARAVIAQVVKATRLWRRERAEVAMELVAHFADGLDAGQSIDELIHSFGDPRPRKLARLIRRAKKRNRSWLWQGMRRFAQFVGVLMLVYIGMWAWLMMSKPNPRVDYVARINASTQEVPVDERAWPIYRKAWIDGKIWDLKFDELEDESGRMVRPGEAGWEKVAEFLDEHAVLIEACRRGGKMAGLGLSVGFDKDYTGEDRLALFGPDAREIAVKLNPTFLDQLVDGSVVGVMLPHLSRFRMLGRLMELDMQEAAVRGDGERVVEDFQSMMGMARQVRETSFLINELVTIALAGQADHAMMQVLRDKPGVLTGQKWERVAHIGAGNAKLFQLDISGERVFMDDFLQRFFSDDGRGDGHVTYDGLRMMHRMSAAGPGDAQSVGDGTITAATLPLAYMMMASRREMREKADHLYAMMQVEMDKPLHEQLGGGGSKSQQEIVAMASSIWSRIRYMPLMMLMPALERAGQVGKQAGAVNEALGVAIGLELYRREHGGYPQSLSELVPRYFPGVPVDHSTGKPLLYVLKTSEGNRVADDAAEKEGEGKRPVLYGRGLDGDDDGGVWDGREKGHWPNVPQSGDWILYPAVKK